VLRPLQGIFPAADYPDLLVGLGDPDDAAVWKLSEERALVVTTDFFTPVVDDPYDYGAIAAANALSDVYAMGGKPFLALNIVALPPDLPVEISVEIMRGGAEKTYEAGVVLAGGHTIQDKEPKYGLVVLGFVHPQKIISKGGARPGDRLFLTKPLGFGVTTTALKQGLALPEEINQVTTWMKQLNKTAGELANNLGMSGGTDITGYSLLGHGLEIASASKVGLRLRYSSIPFIGAAKKYASEWVFPGGAMDNRAFFQPNIRFDPTISETDQLLLFDPQTSGGLLLAVPPEKQTGFLEGAAKANLAVWEIGDVIDGEGIVILE
jgi:selenide, water dikinase